MTGRDLAAMAQGIHEIVGNDVIAHQIYQVRHLGNQLLAAGVPIVEPIGGHAAFLDAKRFLPHLSREDLPAKSLAAKLYLEGGVRAMERGIVSAGRKSATARNNAPKLDRLG